MSPALNVKFSQTMLMPSVGIILHISVNKVEEETPVSDHCVKYFLFLVIIPHTRVLRVRCDICLTIVNKKVAKAINCNVSTQTCHNVVGRSMLRPFTKCFGMSCVVGASLKMVNYFKQHWWMLRVVHSFGQVRATILFQGMQGNIHIYTAISNY